MRTFWFLFAAIVFAVSTIAYTSKLVRLWYPLSAIVFAATTILYVSTFFGFGLAERFPQLVFLPVFAVAAFVAALASLGGDWQRRKDEVEEWVTHNAPWSRRIGTAVFFNAFACFVLFLVVGRGGSPEKRDNQFVAVSHGNVVRELTEAQYRSLCGFEIRFFASFCMVLSGYATFIYDVTRKGRIRPS